MFNEDAPLTPSLVAKRLFLVYLLTAVFSAGVLVLTGTYDAGQIPLYLTVMAGFALLFVLIGYLSYKFRSPTGTRPRWSLWALLVCGVLMFIIGVIQYFLGEKPSGTWSNVLLGVVLAGWGTYQLRKS